MAILEGLQIEGFLNSLTTQDSRTMAELLTRAKKYMSLKEFIHIRKFHDDRHIEEEDYDTRDPQRRREKADDISRAPAGKKISATK